MNTVPTPEKSDQSLRRNPLVMMAVDAMCNLGDLDREGVRHCLPYWRHFWALSSVEIEAVYHRFTDDAPEDSPPRSGVLNPGGGYVSGAEAWPSKPIQSINRAIDDDPRNQR